VSTAIGVTDRDGRNTIGLIAIFASAFSQQKRTVMVSWPSQWQQWLRLSAWSAPTSQRVFIIPASTPD
jgi:hypothetical protein